MPLYNGLDRIDVVVHSDPTEWWQIAAALATLALPLIVTAFAVWYLIESREHEPWGRIQRGLDMALDDRPDRRDVGFALLDQLRTSRGLRKVDADIIAEARKTLGKPQC